MAGGTHVFDMIKKLRENKSLKEKNYFKTKNTPTKKSDSIDSNYKSATVEDREKIKNEILKENEKTSRHSIEVLIISVLVTFVLVIIIVFLVNQMW